MTRPASIPFTEVFEDENWATLSSSTMLIKHNQNSVLLSEDTIQAFDRLTGNMFWNPVVVDLENLGGVHTSMDYIKPGTIPSGIHPATVEHHDIYGPGMHGWNWWEFNPLLRGGDPQVRYQSMALDEVLAIADHAKFPLQLQQLIQERSKFPPGLLSKAGYFLYNDTPTPLLDETGWITPRPTVPGYQDLYLFYYQKDFARALRDYRLLFGAVPLLPRYALGLWYSRLPVFTQVEWREVVGKFEEYGIPLDVVVLDYEWHNRGWNGYDWNPKLFDNPSHFLKFLHNKHIHVTASTWPDLLPVEDSRFKQFIEEAGIEVRDEDIIPQDEKDHLPKFGKHDISIRHHAQALMDVLHKPVQDEGIDFWWVDQKAPIYRIEHPDYQLWTNDVFYRHVRENYSDRRPMIFARASGFGAHRYPFHFTGDTWSYWPVLENQVEHTLRAGHIGQSFMTHDIGGYISHFLYLDPELYIRWVQWGVLSPIFRLHSAGGERRPWLYGDKTLAAFKTAFRLRVELLPYLYTLAWQSAETGMPICRSNALQNPAWEKGYDVWNAYYLGDRIYATPMVRPGTIRPVLLPPGKWYSSHTGEMHESDGCRVITQIAPFEKPPLHYYKAGSLMLKQPYALRASMLPNTLKIELYSSASFCHDTFTFYEDDGISRAFEQGGFRTQIFEMESDRKIRLTVWPTEGKFVGGPQERNYEITVFGRDCDQLRLGKNKIEAIISDQGNVHFIVEGLSLEEAHTLELW